MKKSRLVLTSLIVFLTMFSQPAPSSALAPTGCPDTWGMKWAVALPGQEIKSTGDEWSVAGTPSTTWMFETTGVLKEARAAEPLNIVVEANLHTYIDGDRLLSKNTGSRVYPEYVGLALAAYLQSMGRIQQFAVAKVEKKGCPIYVSSGIALPIATKFVRVIPGDSPRSIIENMWGKYLNFKAVDEKVLEMEKLVDGVARQVATGKSKSIVLNINNFTDTYFVDIVPRATCVGGWTGWSAIDVNRIFTPPNRPCTFDLVYFVIGQTGPQTFTSQAGYLANFTLNALPTSSPLRKTSITCTKGKTIKKVTNLNPKCPAGYKRG